MDGVIPARLLKGVAFGPLFAAHLELRVIVFAEQNYGARVFKRKWFWIRLVSGEA